MVLARAEGPLYSNQPLSFSFNVIKPLFNVINVRGCFVNIGRKFIIEENHFLWFDKKVNFCSIKIIIAIVIIIIILIIENFFKDTIDIINPFVNINHLNT